MGLKLSSQSEISDNNKMHSMALAVVENATDEQQQILLDWAYGLLALRNSDLSMKEKMKRSIIMTQKKDLIFPILKMHLKKIKATLWDDRTTKSKLAIAGMTTGLTFFSGQSAGFAALGGAIGVPLWIVFGAGGTFAGYIIEEIKKKNMSPSDHIDINIVGD